jgi:excisionase family DNA binding protein
VLIGIAIGPSPAKLFVSTSESRHGDDVSNRMSIPEIANRLNIGRLAVYRMLEAGLLPGVRLGRRWIITRHAYEQWERTCGTRDGAGLHTQPEVTVVVN